MQDTSIMEMLGFFGALLAVLLPFGALILRFSNVVTRLSVAIEANNKRTESIEETVDEHQEQIHSLEVTAAGHDVRIRSLENKKMGD